MLFVDGENLLFRLQALLERKDFVLVNNANCDQRSFVWMPNLISSHLNQSNDRAGRLPIEDHPVQMHYCTSFTGGDVELKTVKERLWNLGSRLTS